MTAGCITFEDIESRAESSVALAIHARHIKDGLLAHTVGYLVFSVLAYKVNDLSSRLQTPVLEKCNDAQLSELADLLKQLVVRLVRITTQAEESDLERYAILRKPLQRIENSIEEFDSIIENVYLAINPDFHKAVSSAIDKLHLGVEESATLQR
jgi:hypothetical protein